MLGLKVLLLLNFITIIKVTGKRNKKEKQSIKLLKREKNINL